MVAPVIHYFHQFGVTFDLLRVHSNLSFVPPMKMLNTGTSISPQGTSPVTLCQFNAGTASFSTHCSLSNNPSWENSFGSRDANESVRKLGTIKANKVLCSSFANIFLSPPLLHTQEKFAHGKLMFSFFLSYSCSSRI